MSENYNFVYISSVAFDYSRSSTYLDPSAEPKYIINGGFIDRIRKIRQILNTTNRHLNIFVVMSPSHSLVILLKLFRVKKIILDAGWPLADSTLNKFTISSISKKLKNIAIDAITFRISNVILVESPEQEAHICKFYRVSKKKLRSIYTGVSIHRFDCEAKRPKELPNLVGRKNYMLFRGKMNKESGLNSILDLYLSLPEDFFLVIATNKKIIKPLPERIIVLDRLLEDSEIKWLYENSIASFGQFGNSRRMSRSIPHKFFESVEFNIPYLTPIYAPIMRLLGPEYKFWVTKQNHFDYELLFKIEKFEYPLDLKKNLNSNNLQIQFNDALRSLSR